MVIIMCLEALGTWGTHKYSRTVSSTPKLSANFENVAHVAVMIFKNSCRSRCGQPNFSLYILLPGAVIAA